MSSLASLFADSVATRRKRAATSPLSSSDSSSNSSNLDDEPPLPRLLPPPIPPRPLQKRARATIALLSTRDVLSMDADELLCVLMGPHRAPVELTRAVANVRHALDKVTGNDDQNVLATRVTEILSLITLDPDITRLEKSPGTPPTFGLHDIPQDDTLTLGQLIEAIRAALDFLAEAQSEHGKHENLLRATFDRFEELSRIQNEEMQEAQARWRTSLEKQAECEAKLEALDAQLEGEVAHASPSRKRASFSLALNALQSGRFDTTLLDRQRCSDVLGSAKRVAELHAIRLSCERAMLELVEVVGSRLEQEINRSAVSGDDHRANACIYAVQQLHDIIPHVVLAMHTTIDFQKQREASATAKLTKTCEELEQHQRLFCADEAPTERRDLERRVQEYESILQKSQEIIVETVSTQIELWTKTPSQVRDHAMSELDPIIQPLFASLSAETRRLYTQHATGISLSAGKSPSSNTVVATSHEVASASLDFFDSDATSSVGSMNTCDMVNHKDLVEACGSCDVVHDDVRLQGQQVTETAPTAVEVSDGKNNGGGSGCMVM